MSTKGNVSWDKSNRDSMQRQNGGTNEMKSMEYNTNFVATISSDPNHLEMSRQELQAF